MNESDIESKIDSLFYSEVTSGYFFNRPPLTLSIYVLLVKRIMDSNDGEEFTTLGELKEALSYYIGFRKVGPSVHQIRLAIYRLWEEGKLSFSSTRAGYLVKFRKGEPLNAERIRRMIAHGA